MLTKKNSTYSIALFMLAVGIITSVLSFGVQAGCHTKACKWLRKAHGGREV